MIVTVVGCFLVAAAACAWASDGKLVQAERYLLYVPANLEAASGARPLVLALSPSARSYDMILAWESVADRHGWFIVASKEFHNGIEAEPIFETLMTDVRELAKSYPIDMRTIVATGFSGGAMGAHMLSVNYPAEVAAVVANCGRIENAYRTKLYPRGKLVVFIASPIDWNYAGMRDDAQWLSGRGWTTHWIEFADGHAAAPTSLNEEAAAWLEPHL